MRVILDQEEAWSFMTLVVAQVLDQVELSEATEEAIREWRSQHHDGSGAVQALAMEPNWSGVQVLWLRFHPLLPLPFVPKCEQQD